MQWSAALPNCIAMGVLLLSNPSRVIARTVQLLSIRNVVVVLMLSTTSITLLAQSCAAAPTFHIDDVSVPKAPGRYKKRFSTLCAQRSNTAVLGRLLSVAEHNDIEDRDMPLQFMPVNGMNWEMQFFMAQNLLPQSLRRPLQICHSKTFENAEAVLRKTIGFPLADDECQSVSVPVPVREFGLFAMFHSAVRSIFHAAQLGNASVSFQTELKYWGVGCDKGSLLSCFMHLRGCPARGTDEAQTLLEKKLFYSLNSHSIKYMEEEMKEEGRRLKVDLDFSLWGRPNGLKMFAHVSKVLYPLTMPSMPVRALVDDMQRAMDWRTETKMIGVHVRQGDACIPGQADDKARSCDGLHTYMPWVRVAAATYGIKDVFLATDGGDKVYNETAAYKEFKWHFFREESAFENVSIDSLVAGDSGRSDGFELGTKALADMLLLSRTEVLIGKFTSNVFRAALEVRTGRDGTIKPYASLDAIWCWDVGRLSGVVHRGPYAEDGDGMGRSFGC
eukprot:m.747474 g.747474  ORF g.747474 m.747474 type:complete len:502 (+) comp23143_c1_seq32:309-1814(+)